MPNTTPTESPSDLLRRIMATQLFGFEDKQAVLAIAKMLEHSTQATKDVLAERRRQIEVEGWTPQHDDDHATGALGAAAACYALWASAPPAENAFWYAKREEAARQFWPWDAEWWKPADQRRCLVKAAALCLAEVERRDRAAAQGDGT